MKYDVICKENGCDAHYTHDDHETESAPNICAYCGSKKIEVVEIENTNNKRKKELNKSDFPNEVISTSTIEGLLSLAEEETFKTIKLALAAIEALLPGEDEPEYEATNLFHRDIKLAAALLSDLQDTTEKFPINFDSWSTALNRYIHESNRSINEILNIVQNSETKADEFNALFEDIRNLVYDELEK